MQTEIVRIPVAADRADELAARVRAARATYLAEPDCVDVRVLRSTGNDEIVRQVVAVIDWVSPEAHERANATPGAQSFFAAVQELAAGPPELGWYETT